MTQISDWALEDRLAGDPRPTVVTFVKTGERSPAAVVEELRYLADVYPDARFYEVDLVENPSVEQKYQLRKGPAQLRLPLTLVFVQGVERARHAGPLLVRCVEKALGPHPEPDDDGGESPPL
jgi:hypothetical protein